MSKNLKISLAQFNPIVGDLGGNFTRIPAFYNQAIATKADIVVFPELAICGYPPEDLVLRTDFAEQSLSAIKELAEHTLDGPAIIIGGINKKNGKIYNACFFLTDGKISQITHKVKLPNYGVFDEKRIFHAAKNPGIINFNGFKIGILICEDLWHKSCIQYLAKAGTQLIVSINASPFEKDKTSLRLKHAQIAARICNAPLIYLNQIGGQDELVFDGNSFAIDENANFLTQLNAWSEDFSTIEWVNLNGKLVNNNYIKPVFEQPNCQIYNALKLSLKDYVQKNNFPGIVLGMSGGVDSALTAAICVDALGADKVKLIMLPSEYTSKASIDDAAECASLLGIKLETINIEAAVTAFNNSLSAIFNSLPRDTTEENIQSRTRGVILMAISNKFNYMLVTTGNKSEMSVGYATIYGDMCGGYNLLKDLYKTEVFELCAYINKQKYVIPQNITDKPPSAELKPNQTDQDSLPPYEILDQILKLLIEQRLNCKAIAKKGFELETVTKIAKLVKLGEYKRRQAPPGVKISALAFGKDHRLPITHNYLF